MKFSVTDRQGQTHELTADKGDVLMRVLREHDMGIRAECDGCCACATCHVYIDQDWYDRLPGPSGEEEDMLDEAYDAQGNSRLSCQITLSDEMEGLKVTIAPDWE